MFASLFASPYLLWPISIIIAVFLFSLAVFIHELGHFIAARLLGLRADVFSIGFGPALWKRTIRGTEVRFSAIPFGGYVSLPQLDPEGMKQIQGDHSETLPPAAPWRRIIVAVAGPLGNVVLALLCATAIYCFAPTSVTGGSAEIGYVKQDTSGWNAGLRRGDTIIAVNGEPVTTWTGFQTECFLSGSTNDVVQITYERNGVSKTVPAILDTKLSETEAIYGVGGLLPGPLFIQIDSIIANSPAERAGLKIGDKILKLNGQDITLIEQLTEYNEEEEPATFVILRDGVEMHFQFKPGRFLGSEDKARFGFSMAFAMQAHFQWMAERSIGAQLCSDASGVWRVLKALTMPKHKGERGRAAKGLGGPLMIFGLLIQVVQTGIWVSLGFLRLICINLAILNLLPLPVLDGGHIIFALYALIRRKEASAKVIGYLTSGFAFLLIGVMIWFIFADARRFILNFF